MLEIGKTFPFNIYSQQRLPQGWDLDFCIECFMDTNRYKTEDSFKLPSNIHLTVNKPPEEEIVFTVNIENKPPVFENFLETKIDFDLNSTNDPYFVYQTPKIFDPEGDIIYS